MLFQGKKGEKGVENFQEEGMAPGTTVLGKYLKLITKERGRGGGYEMPEQRRREESHRN